MKPRLVRRDLDEKFMRLAIAEAAEAAREGNAPIGSVLSKDYRLAERGHNQVFTEHDITAHAEVVSIRKLTKRIKSFDLREYTLYSTFIPCAMCVATVLRTNIRRVVYGAEAGDAPQFSRGIHSQANRRVLALARKEVTFIPRVLRDDCAQLLSKARSD